MSKKRTTPARRIHAVSPEQLKRTKRIRIGLGVLAGLVVLILAVGIFRTLVIVPNTPVAVVHGTKITTTAYQARTRYQSLNLAGQADAMRSQLLTLDPDDESTPLLQQIYQQQLQSLQSAAATLPTQVLEAMIEEELIRQEAARRGLTVSDEELEEQVGEWFGYDPNPDPTARPSPTASSVAETPTAAATTTGEATAAATSTTEPIATPAAATAATTKTASPTSTTTGTATAAATTSAEPTAATTTTAAPSTTTTAAPTSAATTTATAAATATGEGTAEATASPEASPTEPGTPEPTATPLPTPTPMTLESYQTVRADYLKYIQEMTGFTEADFLAMMRTSVLQEKLQEAFAAEVPLSAPQVNLRQILVYSQEEIDSINERLEAGEEFGALAQELSQDTVSKEAGGELGWMALTSTTLPQTVVEQAFAMEPGQREVVSSYLGLHLIEALEKADDRPLDQETIEAAKRSALETWISTAAQDEGIERHWSQDKVPEGLPASY